jgi:DNA-binding transcriptional ArsR family regulator
MADFDLFWRNLPKNYMVKYYSEQLDKTFFALSDPIRRSILLNLASGQATVLQLAEPYNVSVTAISKHLKLLERANLVTRNKKGRVHYLLINLSPLKEAKGWIESDQLLESYLCRSGADYVLVDN